MNIRFAMEIAGLFLCAGVMGLRGRGRIVGFGFVRAFCAEVGFLDGLKIGVSKSIYARISRVCGWYCQIDSKIKEL